MQTSSGGNEVLTMCQRAQRIV